MMSQIPKSKTIDCKGHFSIKKGDGINRVQQQKVNNISIVNDELKPNSKIRGGIKRIDGNQREDN